MAATEMVRTSKGLVDALFDSIDQLNAKKIDTEHARAIAHSARAIVAIAALELDVRRFNTETHDGGDNLKSLQIEGLVEDRK